MTESVPNFMVIYFCATNFVCTIFIFNFTELSLSKKVLQRAKQQFSFRLSLASFHHQFFKSFGFWVLRQKKIAENQFLFTWKFYMKAKFTTCNIEICAQFGCKLLEFASKTNKNYLTVILKILYESERQLCGCGHKKGICNKLLLRDVGKMHLIFFLIYGCRFLRQKKYFPSS